MLSSSKPCPHCGHTEVVESNRAFIEATLCEADYHCAGCGRHLAAFSYGAWRESTGEPLHAEQAASHKAMERRSATVQELDALRGLTGEPLIACRKAYHAADGDLAKAAAQLRAGKYHHGMLVTPQRV